MNAETAKIANAILYEGYMLYPYRPSAVKNQQRWNFGVVYPQSYGEVQSGFERCMQQTQCLISGSETSTVEIRVRFLQAVARQVGKVHSGGSQLPVDTEPTLEIVDSSTVGDKVLRSWQEAIERDVTLPAARISDLLREPFRHTFVFEAQRELEAIRDDGGVIGAYFVRSRESIRGIIEARAEQCESGISRLTVSTSNLTPLENPQFPREQVLLRSFLSAHTLLHVADGIFVSLTDTPVEIQAVGAGCRNIGTWPVMIGSETTRNEMLSSPIILYDFPRIAPESPGDLFDGTEIDEILALRILTLSDDEKREISQSDERAREVLQRTEDLPMEHFMKLHGVLRGMKSATISPENSLTEGKK